MFPAVDRQHASINVGYQDVNSGKPKSRRDRDYICDIQSESKSLADRSLNACPYSNGRARGFDELGEVSVKRIGGDRLPCG